MLQVWGDGLTAPVDHIFDAPNFEVLVDGFPTTGLGFRPVALWHSGLWPVVFVAPCPKGCAGWRAALCPMPDARDAALFSAHLVTLADGASVLSFAGSHGYMDMRALQIMTEAVAAGMRGEDLGPPVPAEESYPE
eukprot:365961-Chlamydomonas_euryale.AAC.9